MIYVADTGRQRRSGKCLPPASWHCSRVRRAIITVSTARVRKMRTFINPKGIAVDSSRNVYRVAESYGIYTIRKITSLGVVTTITGLSREIPAAVLISAQTGKARFNPAPAGVTVDSETNLFDTDSHNHTILQNLTRRH